MYVQRRSGKDVHIWVNLETRKDVPIGTSYERSDDVRLKDVFFMSLIFFLPNSLENKNYKVLADLGLAKHVNPNEII